MNTERRHELQQNELAAYLNKANAYIEPYSKQILAAVLVAFAIGIGFAFYSSEQEAGNSSATFELIQQTNVANVDPEALDQVSSAYPGTAAGELAKLYEGLAFVEQGTRDVYEQRELATESLNQGINVLTAVAAKSDEKLMKSRAHFGVALANESLGELDAAVEAYQQVVAIAESEAMVESAEARIAILKRSSSIAFANWFKAQDFSPAQSPNVDPSLPPLSSLPDIGSLEPTFPALIPETGDETAPRDLEGGLDLPTQSDATGDDNKAPAETSEPTETKTETATPATSEPEPAPVTETPAAAEGEPTETTTSASEPEAPAAEAPETDK